MRARSRSRERAAEQRPRDGSGGGGGARPRRAFEPAAADYGLSGALSPPPLPPPPPAAPAGPAEQANFGLSGALARDAATGNAVAGVVLKWTQPPDARLPSRRWRLYVFKGAAAEPLEVLHLHRASAFLFGRDAAVADVRLEHASVSKQHAVVQFRSAEAPREPGDMGPPQLTVKPYVLDLESTHGTFLNGARVEAARYIELRLGDKLRFGASTREYVLLAED